MSQTPLNCGCKCSIKIKNVSVKHGDQVILNRVTLSANHGEILALIGRNGAGKTTLLKAIMGQIPYAGAITFFDPSGNKIDRPHIGYVPQKLSFDRGTPMTVGDLFCSNKSRTPIWVQLRQPQIKRAKELLRKVGGEGLLQKQLGALSGGELQRVLLAFALDPMPDLLLLDEPVSAVDRRGIGVFYELVTNLRKEYHMPILLVSHDIGHVRRYATSAAFLDRSVIVQDSVDKVLRHPVVRETFGLDLTEGGE